MNLKTALKNNRRKKCLEKRRSISKDERKEYSTAICNKIAELEVFQNAKNVLAYLATPDEVDLIYLSKIFKTFSYPYSYDDGIMEARIPSKLDPFCQGKYGILEPVYDNSVLQDPLDIDLVIVPCVGFDKKLFRIGHGQGYYDKFLPKCKNAYIIGVAFDCQKVRNVFPNELDIQMDMIMTETQSYTYEK